jgi:N-methylhydantoinase B/oxoprolinase/acetone carboxylase alpha subunit
MFGELPRRTHQVAGGSDGELGALIINGKPVDPKSLHTLEKGDKIQLRTPGGGYGKIEERDGAQMERDKVRDVI